MSEDVTWTAVALGEGDLRGWLVVGYEPPQERGRGVAGRGVGPAGENRGRDPGLRVLACRSQGVDPRVAPDQRARPHARIDGPFAQADVHQLGPRNVASVPPRKRADRRLTGVVGYRRYVVTVISHYL